MPSSEAVTRGIRVRVESKLVPERTHPDRGQWFYAYTVTISNEGSGPAQLVSRHWVITDGNGNTEHVRGPGVVGHQPRLAPGEQFEYTSFCPLPTPVGTMEGTYQMIEEAGGGFDAVIAPFFLGEAHGIN
jgi:ApaG protein